ncbi:hypothetical protein RRG08_044234 [Elysia crispata]|uniref:Uncharacterized protein n=1 Tax=Elysia crispata TaxID=231223 RepID=A0AAE0XY68_9GAST|nr:hypothetical protein RRG08_044234 [Elysia crispata]
MLTQAYHASQISPPPCLCCAVCLCLPPYIELFVSKQPPSTGPQRTQCFAERPPNPAPVLREVECPGVLFSCRVGDALSGVYELSERSGGSRCSVFLPCWRCTEWCIRAVREKWSVPVFCFLAVLARCTVWCIRAVREKWSVPVFCFLAVLAMHCVVYTSCQREVECPGVLFSCRVGDALSGVYELSERSGVSRCSVFLACWRCTEWCIRAVREKWSVPVFCFLAVLAMH